LAIALGAFGAHALKSRLAETHSPERAAELLATWETGVRYHAYTSLGFIAAGLWSLLAGRKLVAVPVALGLGAVLFSGLLYAYVLTEFRPLVHGVPVGGVCMIVGWATFAWQAFTAEQLSDRS
jgi:uncharacterized membrane protein YgdD (TMEM256/DUF423 family)